MLDYVKRDTSNSIVRYKYINIIISTIYNNVTWHAQSFAERNAI